MGKYTCMALSIVGGAILIVAGIILSPIILGWIGIPERVLPNSVSYLRIYFSGSMFNLVYNMGPVL